MYLEGSSDSLISSCRHLRERSVSGFLHDSRPFLKRSAVTGLVGCRRGNATPLHGGTLMRVVLRGALRHLSLGISGAKQNQVAPRQCATGYFEPWDKPKQEFGGNSTTNDPSVPGVSGTQDLGCGSNVLCLLCFRVWMLNGTLPQFSDQDNPASFSPYLATR
ncbi:RNA processing [Branchiostoma belcheri]|nr:RNA processing [Branchiostoma belcheri]